MAHRSRCSNDEAGPSQALRGVGSSDSRVIVRNVTLCSEALNDQMLKGESALHLDRHSAVQVAKVEYGPFGPTIHACSTAWLSVSCAYLAKAQVCDN